MTNAELITRARSAIGRGCRYGLGKGGFWPGLDRPWDNEMLCDCSGLVAWVLGVSRHLEHPWYKAQNGGWLETSAIMRDCGTPFGFDVVDVLFDHDARRLLYSASLSQFVGSTQSSSHRDLPRRCSRRSGDRFVSSILSVESLRRHILDVRDVDIEKTVEIFLGFFV